MAEDKEPGKEPGSGAKIFTPEGQLGPSGVASGKFQGAAAITPNDEEKRQAAERALTTEIGDRTGRERHLFRTMAARLSVEGRERIKEIDRAEIEEIGATQKELEERRKSDVDKKIKPDEPGMHLKRKDVPGLTLGQLRKRAEREVAWDHARIILTIRQGYNDQREALLRQSGLGAEIDTFRAAREAESREQERRLMDEWKDAGRDDWL